MPGRPILVASGTLRIDRDAALRKLKDYQAADPWTCLAEFVRCANRAGATRVSIDVVRGRALRIRFNGQPFGAGRLVDPFKALLQPGASDAGRHLAVGLLGALRVSDHVVVTSGKPPWRWKSVVRSLGGSRVVKASGADTIVDLIDVSPPKHWDKPLQAACRMARPVVALQGLADARRVGGGPFGMEFSNRFRRGRIEIDAVESDVSTIEVHTRGVLAEIVRLPPTFAPIHTWVDDDGLSFDASRLKLARNRRFRALLAAIDREEARLVIRAAGSEEARGRALLHGYDPERKRRLREAWLRLANGKIGVLDRLFGKGNDPGFLEKVLAAGRTTSWLWRAAEKALGGPTGRKGMSLAKRALWSNPLFLAADPADQPKRVSLWSLGSGGPLVRYTLRPPLDRSFLFAGPAARVTGPRDIEALRAVFRSRLIDKTKESQEHYYHDFLNR